VLRYTTKCLELYLDIYSIGVGKNCTDYVDVEQIGDKQLPRDQIAIFPRLNFTCNGRITNIRVRLLFDGNFNHYLTIQVWRPMPPFSMTYNKIGEVQIQESQVLQLKYRVAEILLTGNDRIFVQSGDVVGFYHPPDSRYQVRTIRTNGYVLYSYDGSNSTTLLSSRNLTLSSTDRMQPLIQFILGK